MANALFFYLQCLQCNYFYVTCHLGFFFLLITLNHVCTWTKKIQRTDHIFRSFHITHLSLFRAPLVAPLFICQSQMELLFLLSYPILFLKLFCFLPVSVKKNRYTFPLCLYLFRIFFSRIFLSAHDETRDNTGGCENHLGPARNATTHLISFFSTSRPLALSLISWFENFSLCLHISYR